MNTINGNFLERTIPSLKGALVTLNMGNSTSEMNLEDFKALMAPEPTPIPEASYKVYTALVTQSGGDEPLNLNGDGGGDLVSASKGTTVLILANPNNTDYSSIGAPNSNVDTYFVLTQDITYNDLDVDTVFEINLGAPTVTVLENTIGNVWFTYVGEGTYYANSNELFTVNKTFTRNIVLTSGPDFLFFYPGISSVELTTTAGDGGLFNTPIEIRVYN